MNTRKELLKALANERYETWKEDLLREFDEAVMSDISAIIDDPDEFLRGEFLEDDYEILTMEDIDEILALDLDYEEFRERMKHKLQYWNELFNDNTTEQIQEMRAANPEIDKKVRIIEKRSGEPFSDPERDKKRMAEAKEWLEQRRKKPEQREREEQELKKALTG